MEPTDLRLELGCQGTVNATVVFEGVASHSARPWLGENAITKAAPWLAEMAARVPRTVTVAGLEFRETFTVTTASGGVANNVVPAHFEVNVNHRYPPDRTVEQAEATVRSAARAADRVEIVDLAPAAPVPEDDPHLERLARVSGAERTGKQAWTDVARLAARGVPAVNYGPGETAEAHRATESVAAGNLQVAFDALKAFLTTR
jgi:succinyl-diaminopimelate desuccinylase